MTDSYKQDTQRFIDDAKSALSQLFDKARLVDELNFALSLNPELRGAQDPGWCTATEACIAFHQYIDFLNDCKPSPIKTRIALSFYCHLAEASGFYEILKNMLKVAGGDKYNLLPFNDIVKKKKSPSISIPPNVSSIFKDLAAYAINIGLNDLAEVFKTAFDGDIRHGYAHADYILWSDGIRMRKRNGGQPRIVTYEEFKGYLQRAIGLFSILYNLVHEHKCNYKNKKRIKGKLSEDDLLGWWEISYDDKIKGLEIKGDGFVMSGE